MDKHEEALKRIRHIRKRIERIRNSLYPTRRIQRHSSVAEDKPPVDKTEAKRNSELEDLKRKLMKK